MIDEEELRARIEFARIKKGFNKTDLSKLLKIHTNTFRKKMENPTKFTVGEIIILLEKLNNDSLIELLFSNAKGVESNGPHI